MKVAQFLIVFLFLGCLLAEVSIVDGVYQLTDDNFEAFMLEHPTVMLKLYAPWCGHCKHLAPEYIQAAKMMEGKPIVFAEMDATKETNTAEQLELEGYPTKIEYPSERTAQVIVDWCEKKIGPSVQKLTTVQELEDLYKQEEVQILVVYLGPQEGEIYGFFNTMSQKIEQSGIYFIEGNSSELIQKYQPQNRLFILKKFDEQRVDLEQDAKEEQIEDFIRFNRFPAVMDLDLQSAEIIFSEQFPCIFLLLSANETEKKKNEVLINELKLASKQLFKKIYMTVAQDDEELTGRLMEFLSVTSESLPQVFIIDPIEDSVNKYVFPFDKINSKNFITFYEGFSKGELKPFLKSQEIGEEFIENVKQLVGQNYMEFLQTEKDKYILVKFYATWCPHCKKLKPIYTKLAGKLQAANNNKIILAEIDSNENEIDKINISGVPTIMFYKPRMESDEPVEYSGKLTEIGLVEFLKQQMNEDWIEIEVDPETEEDLVDEEEQEEEGVMDDLKDLQTMDSDDNTQEEAAEEVMQKEVEAEEKEQKTEL